MDNQIILKAHDIKMCVPEFARQILRVGRYLRNRYKFTKFSAEIINNDFCGNKVSIVYNFE